MPGKSDKPGKSAKKANRWKEDIAASVAQYNEWFVRIAPQTFDGQRQVTENQVKEALEWTENLTNLSPEVLAAHPGILPTLRMVTAPPLARDRLVGLSSVSKTLVKNMETDQRVSPSLAKPSAKPKLDAELAKIGNLIRQLADRDLFPWLREGRVPTADEVQRAAVVVADRLCGSISDPIIRNAQEDRQVMALEQWLTERGYTRVYHATYSSMKPGTFAIHVDVPGKHVEREEDTEEESEEEANIEELEQLGLLSRDEGEEEEGQSVAGEYIKIQIDVVIQPKTAQPGDLPLLMEAKSAGDFTNVNKRRKEEAAKVGQLRALHGPTVRYVLFLCGYFNAEYLTYEAKAGIKWVWEHHIDDLGHLGV
jgi:XamI restriction endonuclease